MFRCAAFLLAVVALLGLAGGAHACTNPAGGAGRIIFNNTVNALQFCDGTNWINLNAVSATAPNTGCTNPVGVRGQLIFNAVQKTHQVCNGSQWADTTCGANVTAGSSCANPTGTPGQIIRATVSSTDALWSCGGGSWARMGAPCVGLAALRPQDVFATSLYTGNGSTQAITNGIDLASGGGLVWTKQRNSSGSHRWADTLRGVGQYLSSNLDWVSNAGGGVQSFNSNGFTLNSGGTENANGQTFAAWTFRRAARFFDVVTWTGNSTGGRQISHNLGVTPGMIIIKRTNASANWVVGHISNYANDLRLNLGDAATNNSIFTGTNASTFNVNGSINPDRDVNESSGTYVAYLFAHDPDPNGVIQCGNFTTNSSAEATVNVGWRPQFVIIKRVDGGTGDWMVLDSARGFSTGNDGVIYPNKTDTENSFSEMGTFNATGFFASANLTPNPSTQFIYCAIREPV